MLCPTPPLPLTIRVSRSFHAYFFLHKALIISVLSILTKIDSNASLCDAEFVLRDVGGQVQYRNQWKEAFLGASCVLYIVSLDDFHKESSAVIVHFSVSFSPF